MVKLSCATNRNETQHTVNIITTNSLVQPNSTQYFESHTSTEKRHSWQWESFSLWTVVGFFLFCFFPFVCVYLFPLLSYNVLHILGQTWPHGFQVTALAWNVTLGQPQERMVYHTAENCESTWSCQMQNNLFLVPPSNLYFSTWNFSSL